MMNGMVIIESMVDKETIVADNFVSSEKRSANMVQRAAVGALVAMTVEMATSAGT